MISFLFSDVNMHDWNVLLSNRTRHTLHLVLCYCHSVHFVTARKVVTSFSVKRNNVDPWELYSVAVVCCAVLFGLVKASFCCMPNKRISEWTHFLRRPSTKFGSSHRVEQGVSVSIQIFVSFMEMTLRACAKLFLLGIVLGTLQYCDYCYVNVTSIYCY